MRTALTIAAALGIVLVGGGCATIVHGASQQISVSSNPSEATVDVDGSGSYKTPTTVKLSRKRDHVLVFRKDGYSQQDVVVMHVVSGAVAGNIIAGGLIGWGVDALSGAQYRLVPETVHVELKPLDPNSPEARSPMLAMTPEERLRQLDKLHTDKLITDEEYEAMRRIILETISDGTAGKSESETPAAAPEQQPAGQDSTAEETNHE